MYCTERGALNKEVSKKTVLSLIFWVFLLLLPDYSIVT